MGKLRASSVYLSESTAIVAAQHYNAAGIYFEQEDPLVIAAWRDGESLSDALRRSLDLFVFKERNLRDDKLVDWPSYRASKCRSGSDFERKYRRLWVMAVNESALLYEASIIPDGERDISLNASLKANAPGADFVQPLTRLFDLCSRWDLMLD